MDAQAYLNQIRKLDELIKGKRAELRRLIDIAEDTSARMPDGMPFTNTGLPSRKMANAVDARIDLEAEINRDCAAYVCKLREITKTIEMLPAREYGAIHRIYIEYKTYERAAEEMGCSPTTVWRREKDGIRLLQKILDKRAIVNKL